MVELDAQDIRKEAFNDGEVRRLVRTENQIRVLSNVHFFYGLG